MDKVGPVLLFLACLAAAGLFAHGVRRWYFGQPRTFYYGDEPFIWVPGPQPFLSNQHDNGDFQYADGTAVTDHRLHRMLQECWLRQNERIIDD